MTVGLTPMATHHRLSGLPAYWLMANDRKMTTPPKLSWEHITLSKSAMEPLFFQYKYRTITYPVQRNDPTPTCDAHQQLDGPTITTAHYMSRTVVDGVADYETSAKFCDCRTYPGLFSVNKQRKQVTCIRHLLLRSARSCCLSRYAAIKLHSSDADNNCE